ncbi:hypothetical protein M432DRAFT_622140 [Thermoascus aurantiacus ATCC 26904]
MARSIVHALLAICVVFSGTPSPAALAKVVISSPSFGLLRRDTDSCPNSFVRCGDSKLPSDFCCPSSSTCISLDDSSSAICCPNGADCSFIEPIACNVQLQNVTANPESTVKTTRLDDHLPICGVACCPYGYTCQGNNTCALNKETSSMATSSVSSSSTLTSAPSTSATKSPTKAYATASATTTSDSPLPSSFATSLPGFNTSSATLAPQCLSFPVKAVVAGFFPGMICGVLAALITMICLKRRRKSRLSTSSKISHLTQPSSGGTLLGISRPIPSEEYSFRTDFLRRNRDSDSSRYTKSTLRRTGTRMKSIFGASLRSNRSVLEKSPPPPPPSLLVTPPQPMSPRRQPSTEFIKVYSPASGLLDSDSLRPAPLAPSRPNTTFTDMMERVGFQNSRGSPCFRVTDTPDPRDRGMRGNLI